MAQVRITLSGDADHGWIGDMHDGDTHQVYNPAGGDVPEALDDMLNQHFKGARDEKRAAAQRAEQEKQKAAQAELQARQQAAASNKPAAPAAPVATAQAAPAKPA